MSDVNHVEDPVLQALSRAMPGPPIDLGTFALVPIVGDATGPDADLLEEALAAGTTVVSEIGAGQVNTVRICHQGQRPLLIIDGEEIVGAKQNRVFNASFVVRCGATVDVPVSCVERGRWNGQSPRFSSGARTLTSSARARKLWRVAHSVRGGGGYDANQGAVWRDVDDVLARTRVSSPTAAFADAMNHRAVEIDDRLTAIPPLAHQIGVAVVRGTRLIGLDLFGSPSLFSRAWPKIARGILGETYGGQIATPDAVAVVANALSSFLPDRVLSTSAPGGGQTLYAETERFVLGGVADAGAAYHAMMCDALMA